MYNNDFSFFSFFNTTAIDLWPNIIFVKHVYRSLSASKYKMIIFSVLICFHSFFFLFSAFLLSDRDSQIYDFEVSLVDDFRCEATTAWPPKLWFLSNDETTAQFQLNHEKRVFESDWIWFFQLIVDRTCIGCVKKSYLWYLYFVFCIFFIYFVRFRCRVVFRVMELVSCT